MRLLEAIKVAHRGKYVPMNVEKYHTFATYNPRRDTGWQEYKKAMAVLGKHRIIRKILEVIGIV